MVQDRITSIWSRYEIRSPTAISESTILLMCNTYSYIYLESFLLVFNSERSWCTRSPSFESWSVCEPCPTHHMRAYMITLLAKPTQKSWKGSMWITLDHEQSRLTVLWNYVRDSILFNFEHGRDLRVHYHFVEFVRQGNSLIDSITRNYFLEAWLRV